MSMIIGQTTYAVGAQIRASFLASGGTAPYTYAVLAGGAGGSIDSATGAYQAPAAVPSDPKYRYDTIQATDYNGAQVTTQILVGTPLLLLCDVIQRGMGLSPGRVYIWDQKIKAPTDAGLFVVLSLLDIKTIGNVNRFNPDTQNQDQYVSVRTVVDVDLISRDGSARERKEELVGVLNSQYSIYQQDANGFSLSKNLPRFVNLSEGDGAAIPYRYKATVMLFYAWQASKVADYFTAFPFQGYVNDASENVVTFSGEPTTE